MTKAVLLGGNGYIGRATNEAWMKADPETEFYVISRSGRNKLTDKRIHNLRADVSDYEDAGQGDEVAGRRIQGQEDGLYCRQLRAKEFCARQGRPGQIPAGQLSSFGIYFSDPGVWQWPLG